MTKTAKRRFMGLAGSVVLFGAVLYSSEVVTNASFWNWSRGFLTLASGLGSLVFVWLLVMKDLIWPTRLFRLVKIIIGILFTPIVLVGAIIVFFMSTCTFTGRHREGGFGDEVKVRDSRVYVDYVGDQGALGAAGLGVFQEKPWIGPFYRRKELCSQLGSSRSLNFRVIDSANIECIDGEKNQIIALPF